MVHRTTETDWKSLYEAETRISAKQAAEIVGLRDRIDELTDQAFKTVKLLESTSVRFDENFRVSMAKQLKAAISSKTGQP